MSSVCTEDVASDSQHSSSPQEASANRKLSKKMIMPKKMKRLMTKKNKKKWFGQAQERTSEVDGNRTMGCQRVARIRNRSRGTED